MRIPAREQCDVVAERYQLLRQPMHHPLGAAIKLGWNSLRQRSNLRDAHLTFSCLRSWKKSPLVTAPARRDQGNVAAQAKFRRREVTSSTGGFARHDVAKKNIKLVQISLRTDIEICCAGQRTPRNSARASAVWSEGNPHADNSRQNRQVWNMDQLSGYARRPFPFVLRYLRQRLSAHLVILTAVIGAVACSVGTQYGVKFLVDSLSAGPAHASRVWLAFVFLISLIAADNFLWRIASWIASFTFVGVTGDLRREMFRHLTGHAPSYFSDRLPGMLTSRITATSNAIFTVENMFVWNVLPPVIATVAAISLIGTVSPPMAAGLIVVAGGMVIAMFHLAAAGKPLHDDYADKAAAVDGEMVDVINNMPLVRAFCGLSFEHDRFDATVNREMTARGRSLRYLEKLRLTHAAVTVCMIVALLAWGLRLWQDGGATTGDVVLICTLGISILSATRDLAVALVDVTQHVARLTEAIATLLQPHELRDHPEAEPLVKAGAAIAFNNVSFP